MKRCSQCNAEKPFAEFHACRGPKSARDGLRANCKACTLDVQHKSTRRRTTRTQYDLSRRFGLSVAEYEWMLELQDGVCAICRKPDPNGRRLAVDHDHSTGTVRDLLCGPCNMGLAHFAEDIECLASAISYLIRHSRGNQQ